MSILSVNGLSKNYGSIHALKNVSFNVPEGSVFGILGPNGSGKTTLLGLLMDVLKPAAGEFSFFNSNDAVANRKKIGTLLETPNFYHYLSAVENLKIQAAIKEKDPADIDRVLGIVDLLSRKHSKFSTYSLGMKQRLAIAGCLLGDPEVLVFDEPTNGLDPEGIAETRELIIKLNKEGKTVIMASHLLDEVEKVCTHVAILQKGTLLAVGNVDEVLVNEDVIEVSGLNLAEIEKLAIDMNLSVPPRRHNNHVDIYYPQGTANPEQVNKYFFERGIVLNHLRLKRKSLEARFFELTQKK
jgi:ABC-type multidrug transport system ATPase subunit